MPRSWFGKTERARFQIRCLRAARLEYSSFFIGAFVELCRHGGFQFRSAGEASRRHLLGALSEADTEALSIFELRDPHESFLFCIDGYDDSKRLNIEALNRCRFYFKVNCNARDIADRSDIGRAQKDRIHPVNSGFPIRVPLASHVRLPDCDEIETRETLAAMKAAALFYRNNRSLRWLTNLRGRPKVHDVHFVVPYYAERHQALNEFRYELIRALRNESRLRVTAGFFAGNGIRVPVPYRELLVPKTSRARHLTDLAASRLAIYVRGVHGCLSFKLGEQLALGLPVVGQNPRFNMDHLARIPHFREQFDFESPDEIVRAAVESIADPQRLNRLSASNAETFDRLLSPAATAAQLLRLMSGRAATADLPQAAERLRMPGEMTPALMRSFRSSSNQE